MRSKTFTEVARRRQLVEGAVEILAEEGFAAASLAAIAARVGVSKGVILYHFAGKDELLREVVSTVLADAGDFMRDRTVSAASPTEALRAYVLSNFEYLDVHRTQIRALTEVLTGSSRGDGEPAYRPDEAVAALAALLTAGQRTGEFGAFDATVAARSLRASIDAVTGLLRTDPDLDVTAYARELLALFERAVLA